MTLDFVVTLLWFSCSPSPCPTVPKGSGVGIGVLPPRAACHQQDVSHQGRAGAQSSGGAAPGYLPNEGPGAIKICSKQSLPFPGTFQKKKRMTTTKKKRTKNPTIIKDKKKTNKKTSRLFPLPPHFPALCFPAPTHLSSLLEDCPQLAPAGLCSAPWGRLGSILLGLNPLGLILLGAGGLAWCVRGAEGTPSVGQCGDRASIAVQNRDSAK